jgi:peptidoglycan/xylan/chitin deacetylase (PgdA/CDA1 family)
MKPLSVTFSNGIEKLIKFPLRASVKLLWDRSHKNWLIILAYHRVSDIYDPQIHLPNGWNQTLAFEQQVSYLKKNYKIVPLFEALMQLHEGTLSGPCIAITIDDGDSSIGSHIAPIMEKYNCPTTIFINSAYLDCDRLHFSFIVRYLANSPDPTVRTQITNQHKKNVKQLRMTTDIKEYETKRTQIENLSNLIPDKQRFFLTKDELKKLDPSLFTIGLHGHEHQRFSMMSADWQNRAIEKNINALKDLENYRPIFALPFGSSRDWNDDTIKTCLNHNLFFLTCTGGMNLRKSIDYKRIFSDGLDLNSLILKEITGIF